MAKRTEWFLLICILVFAAVLRVQAVSTTQIDRPIRSDAKDYYFSALNLQRWSVFSVDFPSDVAPKPDAARPPLMPVLLTPFVTFPPTQAMLFHFNLFQAGLDVVTVAFSFLMLRLFASAGLALGAAVLCAISPHLISLTTYLLTETSFTFFLTGGILLIAYALNLNHRRLAVLGGVVLGLSALTRETTEYLPIFLAAGLYWFMERKSFVRVLVPAVVGALCVIFAWKLRNVFAIGAFSDPRLAANTIHHGIYPDMMFNGDPKSFPIPYQFDPQSLSMTGVGSVLSILWQRAVSEPWHYLRWFLIGKPLAFLQWDFQEADGDVFLYPAIYSPFMDKPLFIVTHAVSHMLHIPLTVAAGVGGVLAVWRPMALGLDGTKRVFVLLIVCVLVYFLMLHMVGFPLARYSVPLRPCIYGLGIFTIITLVVRVWGKFRAYKTGKSEN